MHACMYVCMYVCRAYIRALGSVLNIADSIVYSSHLVTQVPPVARVAMLTKAVPATSQGVIDTSIELGLCALPLLLLSAPLV
jgi:hypothetical protein